MPLQFSRTRFVNYLFRMLTVVEMDPSTVFVHKDTVLQLLKVFPFPFLLLSDEDNVSPTRTQGLDHSAMHS